MSKMCKTCKIGLEAVSKVWVSNNSIKVGLLDNGYGWWVVGGRQHLLEVCKHCPYELERMIIDEGM